MTSPHPSPPLVRAARPPGSRRLVCALLGASFLVAAGCDREEPPGSEPASAEVTSAVPAQAGSPTLPDELSQDPAAAAEAAEFDAGADPPKKWEGPFLAVTSIAAAVYSEPAFDKKKKVGYVRNGGRVPVKPEPVSKKRCSKGWYQIVSGGFICGNQGTTDLEHPEVKFSIKPPDLEAPLPYKYARNAKNGTPLYKSVPSKEQMDEYEPYRTAKKKSAKAKSPKEKPPKDKASKKKSEKSASSEKSAKNETSPSAPAPIADAGASTVAASVASDASAPRAPISPDHNLVSGEADAGNRPPWWQQENVKERLHEVTLEQLTQEANDVLAKRMVEGFYVAVDKSFRWNGRLWHKTTKGLVAPADRLWITEGSKFQGVELGAKWKLPMAWVYGWRKKVSTYEIDEKTKKTKPASTLKRFDAIQLTGRELEVRKTTYFETSDGEWVKSVHVRRTMPGPPPADLEPTERWIDVNLTRQTLVAYVGSKPVYATLVSTGKKHKDKAKDHQTPVGQWRVREKHITTTMDGNGTAAGDLPYSIEDVPYVMYYYRSYALHGAFWHRNYGARMSHGCVNLSPLDSKHLFFFADPQLPAGWHGAWSTEEMKGSRIVVHE